MEDFNFTPLLLKLLDWPFLFTVIFLFGLQRFKPELRQLLSRGRVSLTWGDKSFEISDLPNELEENFGPVADDIELLKQRIDELESKLSGDAPKSAPSFEDDEPIGFLESPTATVAPTPSVTQSPATSHSRQRMLNALTDGQYNWRTVERLASLAGMTDSDAEETLRAMPEVKFSRHRKTGRTIVKLTED